MLISEKVFLEYQELKKQSPEHVLFMQVGAFFQVFGADAEICHDVLEIQLNSFFTEAGKSEAGGMPVSGLNKYAGKLARKGISFAVAYQNKDRSRSIQEKIFIRRENA